MSGDLDFKWFWTPSVGRSGGISVGINLNTFDVLGKEYGEYFIQILVGNKTDNSPRI
jgi:hypothetical protein